MKLDLMNQRVEFKSTPNNYHREVSDIKNNTVRQIDWEDERFHILALMDIRKRYGVIRVRCTEDCQGQEVAFQRRIKDVCIWKNLMIITWEKDETRRSL